MLHGHVFIGTLSLTRLTFIKLSHNSTVDKPVETRNTVIHWYVFLKTTEIGRDDQNFETGANNMLHPKKKVPKIQEFFNFWHSNYHLIDIAPEIPGALTNGTEIPVQSFQKFENACFMRSSSFSEIPESLLHLPLEISGKSNQNFWCNGKDLLDEGLAGVGVWCYLFIKLVGFMKFINLHIHNEHSTFQRNTFATDRKSVV